MVFLCFDKGLISSLVVVRFSNVMIIEKLSAGLFYTGFSCWKFDLAFPDGAISFGPLYFLHWWDIQPLLWRSGALTWARHLELAENTEEVAWEEGHWAAASAQVVLGKKEAGRDLAHQHPLLRGFLSMPLQTPPIKLIKAEGKTFSLLKRGRKSAEFMAPAVTRGTGREFKRGWGGWDLLGITHLTVTGEFCCTSTTGCFGWLGTLGIFWNAQCASTWLGDSRWQDGGGLKKQGSI